MTGKRLELRRRSLERNVNIAAVIFPIVSVLLASSANPHIKIQLAYYPVLVFSGTCCVFFAVLWIVYFESLKKISKNINMDIQKVRHGKGISETMDTTLWYSGARALLVGSMFSRKTFLFWEVVSRFATHDDK